MAQYNQEIKDNIKNTFDNTADKYDTNRQFTISAKKMVQLIDSEDENLNILDLSTGTGNIAIELARKFPNSKIYGVDLSSEMLRVAEKKTKAHGIDNITYLVQDVENLKFDIKFDIISCGYGLFFYPDMDKVFCDVCSRLKQNGKFIFSTFTENAFQPYSKIFLDMLEENYSIKPPSRIEKRQLTNEDEINEISSQVKYKDLKINYVGIKFPMSVDEWWKLLNSTGYSGLLSQLRDRYNDFEKMYNGHLRSISDGENIDYNADSYISIVTM
jgi:ubiquinone/menaquinone biosynthesis C-methylase UbiE